MHAEYPRAVPERASSRSRTEWFLFGLVLVASLVLRILDTGVHTGAPDQVFSIELAKGSWEELIQRTAEDTHPPFYYGLLKLYLGALGPESGLYEAQILSTFFCVGTLGLIFFLGRMLFGPVAGWLALLTAAFSPFQIFWSHVARNHQLLPLFTTGILLCSFGYLGGRRKALWWWGSAVGWVLAIQTNYMAFVFGLAWGFGFLVEGATSRKERMILLTSAVPGVVLFLPWLGVMLQQMGEGPMNAGFFQEGLSPILPFFHSIFGAMTAYQPTQAGGRFWLSLAFFTVVVILGARVVGKWWTFWILLLLPAVLAFALPLVCEWTLAERHLLFTLPLFMVYWGVSLECAGRVARKKLRRIGPVSGKEGVEGS